MRKPDWQTADESIRLYLGDCLDVLPGLKGVDSVLTDPPYGIDFGNGGGFSATHGWGPWRENVEWDKERPSKEAFDAILQINVPTCIWGGNYFTDLLPPSSKWLIWDKGQTDFSLADVEVAWCSWGGAMRRLLYPRGRALKDGKVHPTQKPLGVMEWNLGHLPPSCGPTVLDCYLGSGTTGVACIRTGRRFIGIEKEPKYFAIASSGFRKSWTATGSLRSRRRLCSAR
jgi:DNA modification methylase